MSIAPAEYIGKARAFRTAVVAQHAEAMAVMDRLVMPLMARFQYRQAPSPGAFAKAAQAWRDQVPSAGRLGLVVNAARSRLTIAETRAAPTAFRFEAWPDGDAETVIAITQTTLLASVERFRFGSAPAASVPLHALARRFQRGWDVSEVAIRADLAALAAPRPDMLAAGGDFSVPLADGCWVGTVTEIDDRGTPTRILVVRSFMAADMTARAATASEADVHP